MADDEAGDDEIGQFHDSPQVRRPAKKKQRRAKRPKLSPDEANERMVIVRQAFSSGGRRSLEQAIRDVAEAHGHSRLGKTIRAEAWEDIRMAARRGIVRIEDHKYSLREHIAQFEFEHLEAALLKSIGRRWNNREQATEAATRYLGFRRTGSNINWAFKNVITQLLRRGVLEKHGRDLIRKAR